MNEIYHVFSEGKDVLFRDKADYVFFNNRLATSGYKNRICLLAESIMSTHFHCIAETSDIRALMDFIKFVKKSYALHYVKKYGVSISSRLNISFVHIEGLNMAMNEMLYVMKNPVHHYVTVFPNEYAFSSAYYMFERNLVPSTFRNIIINACEPLGQVSERRRKTILYSQEGNMEWMVTPDDMILPSSYLDINRAQTFWSSRVRKFLYDLNQNTTDANREIITNDAADLRTSGLSDMEVCAIIDDYVAKAECLSFHFLNPHSLADLREQLKRYHLTTEQIRRCLWL